MRTTSMQYTLSSYALSQIASRCLKLMQQSVSVALIWLFAFLGSAPIQAAEEDFLPVEEAFVVTTDHQAQQLNLIFDIAPEYYLYKSRFDFWLAGTDESKIKTALKVEIPEGKHKDDPYFGPVQVYYTQVVARLGFNLDAQQIAAIDSGELQLYYRFQGCAEAGLCYPPQTRQLDIPQALRVQLKALNQNSTAATQSASQPGSTASTATNTAIDAADADAPLDSGTDQNNDLSSADGLAAMLSDQSSLALLWFFLLGVLLAFTPCVLPMVPILSSVVLANKNLSTSRAGVLTLVYVLGMAVTYAALGIVVAYFGAKANLQLYLQHPGVIIAMALLFALLALSMFGLFELRLPQFIHAPLSRLNQNTDGGSIPGVLLMGVLSALVVSPCVSAPLAGALVYIGSTGDLVLGGLSLFLLALGMGVPLLLIGILGPRYIPQSGNWLNTTKVLLGMLLLGVCVWLLARILPSVIDYLLWGIWALALAYCLGAFETAAERIAQCFKLLGVLACLSAGAFFYQAYIGLSTDAEEVHSDALNLVTVTSAQALEQALNTNAQQGYYSVVDLYAEWCVSCIIMEKEIFSRASVHRELEQARFIKFDATDVGAETKAVFARYDVRGLPNIMLIDPQGEEVRAARILGELNREEFLTRMHKHIK